MKRTTFEGDVCPVARALDAVGDAWSLLIVRDAFAGKRRFGEFQESLGVAKNILAARLKKLVACGMLETKPAIDGSVYNDYTLTDRARAFWPVLVALQQWGERSFYGRGECETAAVDSLHGKKLKPVTVQAHDGRVLGPEDVRFVSRRKVVSK